MSSSDSRILAWLVVVACALPARDASADCHPFWHQVVPESDAWDVPINARVWDLGGRQGFVEYDGITVQSEVFATNEAFTVYSYPLRELAAEHRYQLAGAGPHLAFRTGGLVTTTPPAKPALAVHIELQDEPLRTLPVAAIALRGSFGPGVALIRVVVRDALNQRSTFVTTPDQYSVCQPGMLVAPGRARVSITVLDLAGNESEATESTIWIDVPGGKFPDSSPMPGGLVLVTCAPFLLLGILLLSTLRHWRLRRGRGEVVSLLVADRVGHVVLRRATSLLVATAVGVPAALALHHPIWSVVLVVLASFPLSTVIAARRVLRLVDTPEATAEVSDSLLAITSASGAAQLSASARVIRRARRDALPAAALER